jgi:hypothetical protein
MSVDPDAPANRLLTADLVTPPPAGKWTGAGRFVGALVGVATGAANPEDAAARRDVLVTRRDTGATVLHVDSDINTGADETLLDHVRGQLDTLTLGQFLDRWGVDPAALDGPAAGGPAVG